MHCTHVHMWCVYPLGILVFLNFSKKIMPAQLYGFNAHLFSNLSEAVLHPHGAVGVAIMLQVSNRDSNRGIKPLTAQLKKVRLFLAPILFFLK